MMVIDCVGDTKVEIHFVKRIVLGLILANKQLSFSSVAKASNTLSDFAIFSLVKLHLDHILHVVRELPLSRLVL